MKDPTRVPWYVILWRIPWYVIYMTALSVATVAMSLGMGLERARTFWRDNV